MVTRDYAVFIATRVDVNSEQPRIGRSSAEKMR